MLMLKNPHSDLERERCHQGKLVPRHLPCGRLAKALVIQRLLGLDEVNG